MSLENDKFWSEIGLAFEEPKSTPPTKKSQKFSPVREL